MVRRKQLAFKKPGFNGKSRKRPGEGSSRQAEEEIDKEMVAEVERERKAWEKEEEVRLERETWASKMGTRKFICERQLNRSHLDRHPVVEAIERQGLTFFFRPVRQYRKEMVRNFYASMVVDSSSEVITSEMGRVTVEVTPDTIARYLNYRRPNSPNYPQGDWVVDQEEQVSLLTDHPDAFDPKSPGKYIQGKMKGKYRTFNKLVHYNLHPFGLEKTPTRFDGEVLVAFGSEATRVDWALWIWQEMGTFRRKGVANANIPFPVMITRLCEDAGVRAAPKDGLANASPGPIHAGTVKKSASASKAPRPDTISGSLPTSSRPQERNEEWHSIHHARQQLLLDNHQLILDNQRKLETNQHRAKKSMDKMKRWMKWMIACEGRRSGQAYEETEADREESETDLEVLHGFGQSETEAGGGDIREGDDDDDDEDDDDDDDGDD